MNFEIDIDNIENQMQEIALIQKELARVKKKKDIDEKNKKEKDLKYQLDRFRNDKIDLQVMLSTIINKIETQFHSKLGPMYDVENVVYSNTVSDKEFLKKYHNGNQGVSPEHEYYKLKYECK